MSESPFSPSWYRVAELKPRLRSHVQVHRHRYRDQTWYLLQDHATGRFHRFSPEAHAFIGVLDGQKTVAEIWGSLCERFGDDAPTQEGVITLLAQLHSADVLLSNANPDTNELIGRATRRERAKRSGYWRNPVAVRIPLFDPNRLLDRLMPALGWMFSRSSAVLWILVVGTALLEAGIHWSALTEDITDRALALENLLLLALILPLVKSLHELGHAVAVKRWKGEVHEVGLMLLVFVPLPYVDASAASAFRARWQRIVVGAAGMLVELFIAGLAMHVWVNVEPGVVRAIAFDTLLIAGVSTLFFNGNPLLRFDAYYMLMDWLEIPNLAGRANSYIGYLLKRHAFGSRDARSPATAAGEAPWFVFYGLASFAYRMLVVTAIVLLVASKYFVVGLVLAAWAATATLLWPLARQLGFLLTDDQLAACRGRAVGVTALTALLVAAALTAVPLPYRTMAEGVVWTPEESWVRSRASGVITEVLAAPGQEVGAGAALLRLEDPVLAARRRILEAELAEVETRYDTALTGDRVAAAALRAERELAAERLADARTREAELVVRSPAAGVFLLPTSTTDLPGRYVQRGEALGYVVSAARTRIRAAVAEDDVDLVRQRTSAIEVRAAEQVARVVPARIRTEVPAATEELPSGALGLLGGGDFATDPRANGQMALKPLFLFDLELVDEPALPERLGGRVYIRFDHGSEPIAARWYRALRQLLLERFDV